MTGGGASGIHAWSPGDPPEEFLGTLDISYRPYRQADRLHDDIAEKVSALILGARHPERLLPGRADGKPIVAPPYRIDDGSEERDHPFREYYHVDPTGLNQWVGPIVRSPKGLYINPVFMYQDMLSMTKDPEGALSTMGFGRALRLSTLSRYRIGRLRNCTGSSRRALFDIAVSHAAKGDLDLVLEIVANTADIGVRIPDLSSILGIYKGLPAEFILEDLAVRGRRLRTT